MYLLAQCGYNGRFANSLFQYITAKAISRQYRLDLLVPEEWIGRKIFDIPEETYDLQNQYIIKNQAITSNDCLFRYDDLELLSLRGIKFMELNGYWQYQNCLDLYSRSDCKAWLQFQPWILDRFPKGFGFPAEIRNDYIAIHQRRGDYITQYSQYYANISSKSYFNMIDKFQLPHEKIVWVTDAKPTTDEYCSSIGADFLPDFMRLRNADTIVRANSTFGWWAAVLSDTNEIYAPIVEDKVGPCDVEFIKGNWPRCADVNNHPQSQLTDLYLKHI